MARIKYYYDTESCKYERVKVSKWDITLNLLGFLAVALMFGVGFNFLFNYYFDSPEEARLKDQNARLEFYYEELNKEMVHVQEMLILLQKRDDDVYRTIMEAEPIPLTIRNAGMGGAERYRDLMEAGLDNQQWVLEAYKKLDHIRKKIYIQSESYDDIIEMAEGKEEMLASIPAIQPVSNKQLSRFASGFGVRMHPIYKVRKMHYGVDFTCPRGTPIYATGNGTVVRASRSSRNVGAGNQVQIDHGYGYRTHYFHMQDFIVKVGDEIKRGDLIGYVGSTGGSTAPHLHYEVLKDGKHEDPVRYFFQDLNDEEYEEILEMATVENQSLG
ncbi:MAG: M23 family metallopeptidase [Bacteroidota bacterium]